VLSAYVSLLSVYTSRLGERQSLLSVYGSLLSACQCRLST